MKIGIMQPYFFPYLGYFQLIQAVDKFVVYDDVNFIKGGWINRNRLLAFNEPKIFTLTLKNKSSFKKINQIEIFDNNAKLKVLSLINFYYRRAPMFNNIQKFVQKVVLNEEINLAKYVNNSIIELCKYLEIDTKIYLSSEIKKKNFLRGEKKVIHICKLLNGDNYINAIGGQKLYSSKNFQEAGIKLNFIKMLDINYSQMSDMFVPNLSILDIIMFNSKSEIKKMLSMYILI